jgi:prepilin-type N-terminal cleavage/methylation domain-containing protein
MSFFQIKNPETQARGFTIIELIISVSIFAFMTAFLVSKYGTFNQSVLLTNLAYDVALTIRNAQTYGLNVKSKPTDTEGFSSNYALAYGVHFDTRNAQPTPNNQMIFFADVNGNQKYTSADPFSEVLAKYTFKNGAIVSNICAGTDALACSSVDNIDITFLRPNPDAIFPDPAVKYVEITLLDPSGATKKVVVRKTGQIAVLQ